MSGKKAVAPTLGFRSHPGVRQRDQEEQRRQVRYGVLSLHSERVLPMRTSTTAPPAFRPGDLCDVVDWAERSWPIASR